MKRYKISAPPSHGQTVRNITTMSYWDNGWSKTTTDPWDIKTTYDYNELGPASIKALNRGSVPRDVQGVSAACGCVARGTGWAAELDTLR